ncbi:hypothetical protein KMZ32_18850 [Phycicoccus sp. MAQZ13P-2]|nr:hypothetical protein [Phycicoccus mangrovi]MBT9276137.1 hypothetical protein [Phycicoccus mangrovi]
MLHTGLNGRLAEIDREQYVFPEMAEQIADRLRGVRLEGMDDEIAGELTARMQSVNNDRHLRVRRATAGVSDGSGDWEAHCAAEAIQNAGGMRSVGRLDSRTGLLEIAPYTSPVHMAEGHVAAAFALLRGVERLVIDVREGRGGTPETVALICGYLLGSRPIHLQDLIDRAGDARQFWTSPAAARLPDEVPICVLTSA